MPRIIRSPVRTSLIVGEQDADHGVPVGDRSYLEAAGRRRSGVQGTSEQAGPLAHADQAVTRSIPPRLAGRSGTVIADRQFHLSRPRGNGAALTHGRLLRGVGQGFLDDPVGGDVDPGREWPGSPDTESSTGSPVPGVRQGLDLLEPGPGSTSSGGTSQEDVQQPAPLGHPGGARGLSRRSLAEPPRIAVEHVTPGQLLTPELTQACATRPCSSHGIEPART